MIKVRWMGAAGVEITTAGRTVLIDPYLTRARKHKIFFSRPLPDAGAVARYLMNLQHRPDVITVGHTHLDHALDVPEFAGRVSCPVFGSRSLDTLLALHGQKTRVRVCENAVETAVADGLRVTMIPSVHGLAAFGRVSCPGEIDQNLVPPLKARDYRHGRVFMPKIVLNDTVFLHAGTANFVEHELEGQACDVLFLCVPGWKYIPGYPEELLDMVKPEIVIPIHFDDFTRPVKSKAALPRLPFLDMEGFLRKINDAKPGIEVRMPEFFEVMAF
jgi:L-ascorbate metabolism protein UlaG (beta-lactamase superfamily)